MVQLSELGLGGKTTYFFTAPNGHKTSHVANLICSYRASCACEPSVLSIPNGISRTVRHTTVVRITRPSISPLDLLCSRHHVRFACAVVVFVLYSKWFRYHFVIIRLFSSKIHMRKFLFIFQSFHSN